MELFVTVVNGWNPFTIIIKSYILDVGAVLDPLLAARYELTATETGAQSFNL